MIKARFHKQTFQFKTPSGTSRGVLTEKNSWFIELWDEYSPTIKGVGECSIIEGLSPDFVDIESYERKLASVCANLEENIDEWPSIKFGLETAICDLKNGGKGIIFRNAFLQNKLKIPINGLIWMGDEKFMLDQIEAKLNNGFKVLKMKIGAIEFEKELKILQSIRNRYKANLITLRVDANGAFTYDEAIEKTKRLAELEIHSIEQPIMPGQWKLMSKLCRESPISIALDEELILIHNRADKINLLETINPQYIIIKPSLHGGISGSREWIELCEQRQIPWWITSALESNIGLDALCQFVSEYDTYLEQGLGTGSLFTNNIDSDLRVENGCIFREKR